MLVEAEDAEQAFRIVSDKLSESPDWSDWHEGDKPDTLDFAGRWSGAVFITPEQQKLMEQKIDVDLSENPNHLRFSDDRMLADEVIANALGYRRLEIENTKDAIKSGYPDLDLLGAVDFDPYSADFHREMGFYYYEKLVSLYKDAWTPHSAIYDLEAYTANLCEFIERVKKSPERQFLIPVDFHY